MIRSFRDEDTKALYEGRFVRRFQGMVSQAERRHSATTLRDLAALPSNRLEALLADRKGQYSIRINQQWCICFEWREDGPYAVQIVDYH